MTSRSWIRLTIDATMWRMPTFLGVSGTKWRYAEVDQIGEAGGFGTVFRGEDETGKAVAVKKIPLQQGFDATEARRRRDRELDITKMLVQADPKTTEHICIPLDVATDAQDSLMIVMPLARESLAATIASHSINVTAATVVLTDICYGLSELSALGILHRDLTPRNVLRFEEQWRIADFGLSRDLSERTGTFTFAGYGTRPYMAPEIWENKPATIKSDLYSLGVIAYELLTGRRPFLGPNFRTEHLEEPVPQFTVEPLSLCRLVNRLLSKNPARRPQDARDVVEELSSAFYSLTAQQRVLQAAVVHAEVRQSESEAHKASQRIHLAAATDLRTQAWADLANIFEGAAEIIQPVLKDVTVDTTSQISIRSETSSIEVTCWLSSSWPRISDDGLVDGIACVGGVKLLPRPTGVWDYDGNVICALQNGRLYWHFVRFLGPGTNSKSRPRGFSEEENFQNFWPDTSRTQFTSQGTPLNVKSLVEIFTHYVSDL